MAINVFFVESLSEYYDAVTTIGKNIQEEGEKKSLFKKTATLWFRGESQTQFTLIPSLYRSNHSVYTLDKDEHYSSIHYKEDIRVQHYHAKNYHYLSKEPSSRIEWLEVMQHHGVHTRVLDWSESSTHSLLFALERFYNHKMKDEDLTVTPCVWVLNPQGVNQNLFKQLGMCTKLQKEILYNLNIKAEEVDKIVERIADFTNEENMKKYLESDDTYHIDYLVNLSEISDELHRHSAKLEKILLNRGAINPLYYLLEKIYSEGHILKNDNLPPLAVVHPYHSERIKVQKGVFTVFPVYQKLTDNREHLKFLNINPDSMSFNDKVQEHLYKIVLCKPQKIAYEILTNGMNESWLYPEMPIISNEIENHSIC